MAGDMVRGLMVTAFHTAMCAHSIAGRDAAEADVMVCTDGSLDCSMTPFGVMPLANEAKGESGWNVAAIQRVPLGPSSPVTVVSPPSSFLAKTDARPYQPPGVAVVISLVKPEGVTSGGLDPELVAKFQIRTRSPAVGVPGIVMVELLPEPEATKVKVVAACALCGNERSGRKIDNTIETSSRIACALSPSIFIDFSLLVIYALPVRHR